MPYRELHLDGKPIGGCMQMDENFPPGLPTHWMVYFAVADCDATADRAKALGGTVHVEPMDIPVGRMAVIQDPGGAVCAVINSNGRCSRRPVLGQSDDDTGCRCRRSTT